MAQPAGRLLGVKDVNSVWLRASPLLCALNALAVLVRSCVYCVALGVAPQQAVVLIGTDRFQTSTSMSASTATTTAISTAVRLAGFGIGLVPLGAMMWFEPGGNEARWTAAWAWMFVGSYIVLEIVIQVCSWAQRQAQTQPKYTAVDFELDDVDSVDNMDNVDNVDNVDNLVKTEAESQEAIEAVSETDRCVTYDAASVYAESETTLNDDMTAAPDDGDGSSDAAGLLWGSNINTTSTTAAITAVSPIQDVEANRSHPYETSRDPSAHPRLPLVNALLAHFDMACLALGCLAQAALLYWAFLDLVQPQINAHMLAVDVHKDEGWSNATPWATPIYYMSTPLVFLVYLITLALGLGCGAIFMAILVGLSNLSTRILPASVRACAGGIVPGTIMVVAYGLGGLGVLANFFAVPLVFAKYIETPHLQWIYEMLTLEFCLLLLFVVACFVFYSVVKGATMLIGGLWKEDVNSGEDLHAETTTTVSGAMKRHIQQYMGEDSVALFFVVLLTLLLTIVWYAVRFAGSANWAQHWADALVANITANSTNTTLAKVTITPTDAVSATPVRLF
ncbi:MAG: hypothetical protein STHCBS139747_004338 [Sporothrix thermara]